MIAVIFEVWPAEGRKDDYLAIAASLRDELERIDGFISVERFQSIAEPGKLLSLSFWRDEEAVARWRNQAHHRESQAKAAPVSLPTTGYASPRCCAIMGSTSARMRRRIRKSAMVR